MGKHTLRPNQNNMLKTLVNFAILTTVVIAVWIFVSVFHNFTSTTISETVATQIEPIPATFDVRAISILQKRIFIPTDLSETIPYADSDSKSATQSGKVSDEPSTVTPTPTATSSGLLVPNNF